ncbi:MAG: 2Fe-2S iron-sulfur cluster-binding protein [Pseudomonadota bacterium]
MKTINLTVNGKAVSASVEPRTQLADFLRDALNLTGTHLGCEHGVCGACTLFIDGVPARSCITLAIACDGASITTIEGFDDDEIMRALREAFSREHGLQCGYCTPGMLASARDTVMRMPDASEHDIRVAMSGNLCRCTGYVGIVRAIQSVIAERKAKGLSSPGYAMTALGPAGSGHATPTAALTFPSSPTLLPEGEGSILRPSSSARDASVLHPSPPGRGTEGEGRFKEGAAKPGKPLTTLLQSFSVDHSRTKVWDFFGRLGEVTTCLPGTSLLGTPTDDHVEPRIRIKIGPIVAEFEGVADVVRDPANYAGIIRGSARDTRSNSMTRGEIRYVLHEDKGGTATRVDLEVGFTLTGALAQFSRSGLVQDIAKRMTVSFAQNLQARLNQGDNAASAERAAPAPASELDAGSLIFAVIWERIKTFFRTLLGR